MGLKNFGVDQRMILQRLNTGSKLFYEFLMKWPVHLLIILVKKKYISKRYLDKKKKEFLEIKQGNKSMAEYKREFVYLNKYAREIMSTEEETCTPFENKLNNEIKMMIGGTEIR
ncbi:Hexaprenyldihydroxybenzoate methyltransferase, mitochondrial-like protein [Gossypium australe]|uniref:Hexaprenyldihydroxybenzoate methyltransferase, mitochondrial-like protein n=1 Tax=Gossypium australe TaxID=47621 RepID=A0A5B6WQA1_9ROSI|nr:Hexaprenyldihydroxybenzoate methyltransferase, mitochondrial-like protein [Gossypium australe]